MLAPRELSPRAPRQRVRQSSRSRRTSLRLLPLHLHLHQRQEELWCPQSLLVRRRRQKCLCHPKSRLPMHRHSRRGRRRLSRSPDSKNSRATSLPMKTPRKSVLLPSHPALKPRRLRSVLGSFLLKAPPRQRKRKVISSSRMQNKIFVIEPNFAGAGPTQKPATQGPKGNGQSKQPPNTQPKSPNRFALLDKYVEKMEDEADAKPTEPPSGVDPTPAPSKDNSKKKPKNPPPKRGKSPPPSSRPSTSRATAAAPPPTHTSLKAPSGVDSGSESSSANGVRPKTRKKSPQLVARRRQLYREKRPRKRSSASSASKGEDSGSISDDSLDAFKDQAPEDKQKKRGRRKRNTQIMSDDSGSEASAQKKKKRPKKRGRRVSQKGGGDPDGDDDPSSSSSGSRAPSRSPSRSPPPSRPPSPAPDSSPLVGGIHNEGQECYGTTTVQLLRGSRQHLKLEANDGRMSQALASLFDGMDAQLSAEEIHTLFSVFMMEFADEFKNIFGTIWDLGRQHDAAEFISAVLRLLSVPSAIIESATRCNACDRPERSIGVPFIPRTVPAKAEGPVPITTQTLLDDWRSSCSLPDYEETEPTVPDMFTDLTHEYWCQCGIPKPHARPEKLLALGSIVVLGINRAVWAPGKVMTPVKILSHVSVLPLDGTDGIEEKEVFCLKGLAFHHGPDLNEGHWMAVVRDGNGWALKDDSRALLIKDPSSAIIRGDLTESPIPENACLALYERIDSDKEPISSEEILFSEHVSETYHPPPSPPAPSPLGLDFVNNKTDGAEEEVEAEPEPEADDRPSYPTYEDAFHPPNESIADITQEPPPDINAFGDAEEAEGGGYEAFWSERCARIKEETCQRQERLRAATNATERLNIVNAYRNNEIRDNVDTTIVDVIDSLPGMPTLVEQLLVDPLGTNLKNHLKAVERVTKHSNAPRHQEYYIRQAELSKEDALEVISTSIENHPLGKDVCSGMLGLLEKKQDGEIVYIKYIGMTIIGAGQRHKDDSNRAHNPASAKSHFLHLIPLIEAKTSFKIYRIRGLDQSLPGGVSISGGIEEYLIDIVGPAAMNTAHGGRTTGKFSPEHTTSDVCEMIKRVQQTYGVPPPKCVLKGTDHPEVQQRVKRFEGLVNSFVEYHNKRSPTNVPPKAIAGLKVLGSLIRQYPSGWCTGITIGQVASIAETKGTSNGFDDEAGDGRWYVKFPAVLVGSRE
ncbi:hypothetical protein DL93DRAFT_1086644 [Clavulina sp. PMI_390]|nr:hypothetical protein DL93DRAFT_1086644 [Clavulina sp. PMI_390]